MPGQRDPQWGVWGHRHGISQCFGLAWKRGSRTLVEPQLQGTTMCSCWEKPSRKFSNGSWRARKILVYYYLSCVWLSCCKSNSQESPGESQKHAAVLAGSVPRSLGTTRSREPSPTTACHRCSSQARPCLLPNRRQRTPQRYSECLQVSPPAMSHNPLPGLTGQVPNLIAGSSRSEICYF